MTTTARTSLKLSLLTIVSRILGVVRDHFQAIFFGTGIIATAWEIAFMFPNMLRNLLAEGILAQSFMPIYSEALAKSQEEADKTAGVIISFLFIFLMILVSLVIVLYPFALPVYAGQTTAESHLLIQLSQILFIFILTASLTAIFAGISNTHYFFTVPALSPILLNLVIVCAFVFLLQLEFNPEANIRMLAGVVVLGGILQLFLQSIYVRHKGYWPKLTLQFRNPALKKIIFLMGPAVLGASLFQLNQLIDIAIASYMIPQEYGAVPALRFAHRLVQLPTGIIGAALSTAILPILTDRIRNDKSTQNGAELMSALSFSFFLTVPAGIGLFLLGPHVINFLFYGGEWHENSTASTWMALQFYCLGVPFYSLNKILTSTYYAYQDTRTPVKIAMPVIFLNLILNLVLVRYLFQGGLALSTVISSFASGFLLLFFLKKRAGPLPWKNLILRLRTQLPIWVALLIFLLAIKYYGSEHINNAGVWLAGWFDSPAIPRYIGLIHILVSIPAGAFLYFFLAYLLKIKELRAFSGRW